MIWLIVLIVFAKICQQPIPPEHPQFLSSPRDCPDDARVELVADLSLVQLKLFLLFGSFVGKLPSDTYETIHHRLTSLLNPENWEISDTLPNAISFTKLLQFLSDFEHLREPRIALARNGNFVLSWRAAQDQLVTLEFLPSDVVRWLVFAPPPAGSTVKQRATGQSSRTTILDHISPYGVLNWLKRAP